MGIDFSIRIPKNRFKIAGLSPGRISLFSRSALSKVRSAVIRATPKDTGKTRKAWTPVRKGSEGSYSFSNPLPQTAVLESGSTPGKRPWPSVGPRTVANRGRIFSSQAPEGILEAAGIEEIIDKEINDFLEKLENVTG